MAFCARRYKRLPQLYDVSLTVASVNKMDKALVVELLLEGFTKFNAITFAKNFFNRIEPKR